ncbi:MAG TPA: G1 family glutamic endopeptidase [Pseudonocardiaceae bacterium]|nr:G1 family glutamic endopeptidase [Pseudonocardiaceae bacterium]
MTTIVVALATVSIGIAVAEASPEPGTNAVPVPQPSTALAQIVPGLFHSNVVTNATAAGTLESFNWSGYVAPTGPHTTVTSTWVQPEVTCTSNGLASFWVGLDGWNDKTVEQTGTGVDCRSGSPVYDAWWQTFPTNSQQTYTDVTVAPGDTITATVTATAGSYVLALADQTQGWSKSTKAAAPAGATNANAEVVTEAASLNNATTVLPDFGTTSFTGSSIDGGSLQAASAQPVTMVNQALSAIATTTTADATGDFDVHYAGGLGNAVQGAFQASDGTLHSYAAGGDQPQKQPIAPGTSPAIAQLTSGTETVYQGTNGDLTVSSATGPVDTGLVMAPGTSPSVIGLGGGGYEVAYQSAAGQLWTYSSSGFAKRMAFRLAAGTSPSITALSGGTVEVVFQTSAGTLGMTGSAAALVRTAAVAMAPGSSPSVAAKPGGGFVVAYQAGDGTLAVYDSATSSSTPEGVAMAAGTGPSIAVGPDGDFMVAVQSAKQTLTTFGSATGEQDGSLAMLAGTSPVIVAVSGGFETAVQTATGTFAVTGVAGDVDTTAAMAAGTSPAIAP